MKNDLREDDMSDTGAAGSGRSKWRKSSTQSPWTVPVSLIVVGVIIFAASALLGPMYIGFSQTTTGTILSSPTSHPVVSYTVDGTDYTVTTTQNNPSWEVGDSVTIAYNPKNPAQAGTSGARLFAVIFRFISLPLFVAGIIGMVVAGRQRRKS